MGIKLDVQKTYRKGARIWKWRLANLRNFYTITLEIAVEQMCFTYDLLTNILDPASNTILEELQPDTKKDGGKYMTYTGNFRFYDAEKRVMKFVDGMVIGVGQVCRIEMK